MPKLSQQGILSNTKILFNKSSAGNKNRKNSGRNNKKRPRKTYERFHNNRVEYV